MAHRHTLLVYTAVHSWAVNHTVSGWAELVTLDLVKLVSSAGVMEKHLLNRHKWAERQLKQKTESANCPKQIYLVILVPTQKSGALLMVKTTVFFVPVHPCRSLLIFKWADEHARVSVLNQSCLTMFPHGSSLCLHTVIACMRHQTLQLRNDTPPSRLLTPFSLSFLFFYPCDASHAQGEASQHPATG